MSLQPAPDHPARFGPDHDAVFGFTQESQPGARILTLVTGLPGAGKSSFVDARLAGEALVVRFDAIRLALGSRWNPAVEPFVSAMACALASMALHEGRNAVVDESITTLAPMEQLAQVAAAHRARLRLICARTPVQECRARRVPHDLPAEDFDRKVAEWGRNGRLIRAMADEVVDLNPAENRPNSF